MKTLVRDEVRRQFRTALAGQLVTVTTVNPDGTVDVNAAGTVLPTVACQRSYTPRAVGDVVMLLWSTAGPRVTDVVGPEPA